MHESQIFAHDSITLSIFRPHRSLLLQTE